MHQGPQPELTYSISYNFPAIIEGEGGGRPPTWGDVVLLLCLLTVRVARISRV